MAGKAKVTGITLYFLLDHESESLVLGTIRSDDTYLVHSNYVIGKYSLEDADDSSDLMVVMQGRRLAYFLASSM